MSGAVEQIKNRLDIVEVVGSYLKLEKSGINFRALCPFHHEKTPSFFVSPSRQGYYCFGCNRGGDMISFVEEIEGLDFLGALRVLADRAGVKLEPRPAGEGDRRERLFDALRTAAGYFADKLRGSPSALRYYLSRGLNEETVKFFGLGYAPTDWHGLYDFLRRQRFSDREVEEAGLVVRSTNPKAQSRYLDRFRGRLMFPLFDSAGRVAGFSGRVFPPVDDPSVAKYVNTPQTLVYSKSRLLYGFDKAKLEIRKRDAAILVEGQFDLLLAFQSGTKNAVAVSGTALTREHLEAVSRLSKNLIMAFDSDRAGEAAARRAIELALGLGLEVKIAELPTGVDPAELISREPEAWRRCLENAKSAIDFHLDLARRKFSERRLLARAIKNDVYPFIGRLSGRVERAFFIKRIAEELGLTEEVITKDLEESLSGRATAEPSPTSGVGESKEQRLLERLFGLLWWRPEAIGKRLEKLFSPADFAAAKERLTPRQAELILQTELLYGQNGEDFINEEVAGLLRLLEKEIRQRELQKALVKLRAAEKEGDSALVESWLKMCQDITTRLNYLTNDEENRQEEEADHKKEEFPK